MTETLLRSRAGARLTLTLNRPQRLNALDLALWDALGDAALAAAADPELRVVIVTGAGGAFAAGGDIEEFQRVRRTPATQALADCPHPVVAAINGACVGGGLEIAASCDLRIATASARFGIPVARLAMAAPPEAVEALVDLIGPDQALSLLLEARLIDAAEALRLGLVTRVAADDAFTAEIDACAARIEAGGPLAARAHKRVARAWAARRAVPSDAVDQAYACIASDDFRAGIAAFLAKRKPVFEGQ
jgi:enoyl-CoA hydratase/carnithine racemase